MLKKLLDTTSDSLSGHHQESLRFKHFLVFCVFGLPTMVIFAGYNFLVGNVGLMYVILLAAFSLLGGMVILFRNPGGLSVYRICGCFYCFLLLFMFVIGGDGGSKSLWLFTFPLIGFFMLGRNEGMVWSFLLLGCVVILRLWCSELLHIYEYSNQFFIRLVSVYVLICGISAWFEHFRTSYYQMNRRGNQMFNEVLENSRDILYRRDVRTGKYDFISKAFYDHLGYEQSDFNYRQYTGVESLIHPDDRERHADYLEKVLHGDNSSSLPDIEYRMKHKSGHYIWFSDRITVVKDAYGNTDHVIGMNREITQERKIRLSLESAHQQTFTILSGIDAHVYAADMDTHTILFMNQKMVEDFGEDYTGEICWKKFRDLDGPCSHCNNHKLLDEKLQPTGVHEWDSYNPVVKKWYRNFDRAIQWVDGRWARLQIAVDITRARELEEERKKSEKVVQRAAHLEAIGSLAGGIAHDFNNLLQVVHGNLDLIDDTVFGKKEQNENFSNIREALKKAKELADKLITFSPGGVLIKEHLPVRPLIEVASASVQGDRKGSITHTIEPNSGDILGDRKQVMLALRNVLTNSFENLPEGGSVQITVKQFEQRDLGKDENKPIKQGRYVEIVIMDNGSGIDQENISRIFDPYFTTKEIGANKGTGLGLSIAYSIIKRHDGYISITSEAGQGTTVFIYLPSALQHP